MNCQKVHIHTLIGYIRDMGKRQTRSGCRSLSVFIFAHNNSSNFTLLRFVIMYALICIEQKNDMIGILLFSIQRKNKIKK